MRKMRSRYLTLRTLHNRQSKNNLRVLNATLYLQASGGRKASAASAKSGRGVRFQLQQIDHRVAARGAAHIARRLQTGADRRPQRRAEQFAAQIGIKLNARGIGGFALRHTWDGRRDRRRGTAGAALTTALHDALQRELSRDNSSPRARKPRLRHCAHFFPCHIACLIRRE